MKQNIEKLEINGVSYVREDCLPTENDPGPDNIRIVVLQRGWVMVGKFKQDEHNCVLEDASVIRYWGTTKGLGEIAKDGPTSKTKLDPCNGVVRFHELTAVVSIDCEASKWKL